MAVNPEPGSGGFAAPGHKGVGSANAQKTAPKKKGPDVGSTPGSPCLISFPSAGLPLVGSVGGGCLFSKTAARALVGGLLIGAGGLIFIGGIVILAAAGFRKTGAVDKLAAGVAFVPGAGPVAAAGIRSAARPEQRHARRASQERRQMRQLGEPRENPGLRTGRGAVRETPAGTRRRKREGAASREEAGF